MVSIFKILGLVACYCCSYVTVVSAWPKLSVQISHDRCIFCCFYYYPWTHWPATFI